MAVVAVVQHPGAVVRIVQVALGWYIGIEGGTGIVDMTINTIYNVSCGPCPARGVCYCTVSPLCEMEWLWVTATVVAPCTIRGAVASGLVMCI